MNKRQKPLRWSVLDDVAYGLDQREANPPTYSDMKGKLCFPRRLLLRASNILMSHYMLVPGSSTPNTVSLVIAVTFLKGE